MSRRSKIILRIAAALVIALIVLILCISPIAKYLIEKHDIRLTGREITTDWVYVNPITGYAYLRNVLIYEQDPDSIFLSAKGLGINFSVLKLFSSNLEFTEISLNKPRGFILQNGTNFNFTDLIERFTPESTSNNSSFPKHFSMLNLHVLNGEFHYRDLNTEVYYYIKNVEFHSPGFSLKADSLPFSFGFEAGIGTGRIDGECTLKISDLDYRLAVRIDSLDLNISNQYLRELVNYGTVAALMNADMRFSGNLNEVRSNSIAGSFSLNDFHFGKNSAEEYASFKALSIDIVEVSPDKLIFQLDSITLLEPFFRYELYDHMDNIQTMFGENGSNVTAAKSDVNQFNLIIEIADLIENLSRNFLRSNYKIGHVSLDKGNFQFADYSLNQQFLFSLEGFTAFADSVDKGRDRIELFAKSNILPYGNLQVMLSVNPKDSGYFDIDYGFRNIAMSMFNPYMITYTSFPLDRGILSLSGEWHVNNGVIQSMNHLVLLDTRLAKRVRNKNTRWIPMPLILAFINERGNSIDYEIPVRGNLKDPSFKIADVLLDLLRNIFIKPVTIPYRMEVKSIERKLEKSHAVTWGVNQFQLNTAQREFIEKMINFLKDEPDAQISVQPVLYEALEKEMILLFEAKKLFFLSTGEISAKSFSARDSIKVMKLSIKDPAFVTFLAEHNRDNHLFTAQHKSATLISEARIAELLGILSQNRIAAFMEAFMKAGVAGRVRFTEGLNNVPFNGFSYFKISYSGEIPNYLIKALHKMSEFNSEDPREKYREVRKSQNSG